MQKILFFLVLLPLSTLIARENPFFPVDSSSTLSITTNQTQNLPPLKRVNLKLPSTARVIEKVTVEYKNLDGSLAKKSLDLEHSIDWHLPIAISQSSDVTVVKKVHLSKKSVYKRLFSLKFITLYANAKRLKIVTKDKLLRNFLLVQPNRIVCDFKRDVDIKGYSKNLRKTPFFKKIRIGTHEGYYRVVVRLDGYYQYTMQEKPYGYLFNLH